MLTQVRTIFIVLAIALGGLSINSSYAQTAAASAPTLAPDNTQQVLTVLTDPAKRDALINTLEGIEKAQKKVKVTQHPIEVITQGIKNFARTVFSESSDIMHTIANFKALIPWMNQVYHNPFLEHEVIHICLRVALVALGGFFLSKVVRYILRKPRQALENKGQKIGQATVDLLAVNDKNLAKAQKTLAASLDNEQKIRTAIADQQTKATDTTAASTTAVSDPNAAPSAEAVEAAQKAHEAAVAAATGAPAPTDADSNAPASKPVSKTTAADSKISEVAPKATPKTVDLNTQLAQAIQKSTQARAEIAALEKHARQIRSRNQWKKIPYGICHFWLDMCGIAMFPIVTFLIQTFDTHPDPRIMASVWSVTWSANVGQSVWVSTLFILFACNPHWIRIAPISNAASLFLFRWLRRIGASIAWGLAAIIIMQSCTLPSSVTTACGKLLALVVHIMLAIMIIHARRPVREAALEFAEKSKRFGTIFKWSSEIWWVVALFFDLALWFVWAADIRRGYQLVLEVFIRTSIALLISRGIWMVAHNTVAHLFGSLTGGISTRVGYYYPALQKGVSVFVVLITGVLLAIAWNIPIASLFIDNHIGEQLMSSTATIVFSLIMGVIVWEAANIFIEHQVQKLDYGESATVSQKARMARVKTLQPLLKILLLIILVTIIGMTILSEIGLNITPLLASASIFGVALGFGSQKLVHDFISGIFLLLENALAVGDAVTLNGTYGVIEKLSLRTVHVRASDGSLNIFPFSSLDKITNFNRGFCRAMVEADVSYDTNVSTVIDIFNEITAGLRKDPNFAPYIIDDFKVWGLSNFGDSSIAIKGTIPVIPSGRWPVTWEFNRRMYDIFNERGINMPYPTRTLDIPDLDTFVQNQLKKENGPSPSKS